jgi:methyl-accepting chemotaxis protein-2 (aspartate sensor receptor)
VSCHDQECTDDSLATRTENNNFSLSLRHCSVGGKITVFFCPGQRDPGQPACSPISIATARARWNSAEAAVASELNSVMTATEVFHAAMVNEAGSFARLFAAEFAGRSPDPDDTVAVAGKATPRLSNGGKVLNLDTATVDRYTANGRGGHHFRRRWR